MCYGNAYTDFTLNEKPTTKVVGLCNEPITTVEDTTIR